MPGHGKFVVVPLYLQVRNLLAERIAAGLWRPGAMLPNEQELARELGVSPGTVRKALDSLEQDRLLLRRQGRGTFVADQTSRELAVRFSNIRNSAGQRIVGELQLLSQTKGAATATEQERLELTAGEPIVRTKRLRRDQGRAFMHEEACLAASRFPGLEGADVGSYSISALAQQHGVHLARASERLTLEEASPEAAGRLAVAPSTPLLKVDRVVFAMSGQPVEWRVGLCHLDDDTAYLAEMH